MPFRWPFFDIDYATLITKPSLSFLFPLSLSSNRFPDACLLCFLFQEQNHQWETCKTEDSNTVGTPIGWCSRSWFSRNRRYCGSDRWWAPCNRPQKRSCRTLWALYPWSAWNRPGSQTPGPRAECALPALFFKSVKFGRIEWTETSVRSSRSGKVLKWRSRTSRSKDGWNMRREKVRWQRDDDMRTADTLEPCMCVTRMRMCEMYAQCIHTRKMCVQQVCVCVCVHSPSHTQWLLLRGCELLWVRPHYSEILKKLITPWPIERTPLDFLYVLFWFLSPRLGPLFCFSPMIRCMSQWLSVSRGILVVWFSMMPLCGT